MSTQMDPQDTWKYAKQAMAWYGWGSPIGLGAFVVAAGLAAALVRYALAGG
jgi:hypothetical protein